MTENNSASGDALEDAAEDAIEMYNVVEGKVDSKHVLHRASVAVNDHISAAWTRHHLHNDVVGAMMHWEDALQAAKVVTDEFSNLRGGATLYGSSLTKLHFHRMKIISHHAKYMQQYGLGHENA
jgi:hypothetical protein